MSKPTLRIESYSAGIDTGTRARVVVVDGVATSQAERYVTLTAVAGEPTVVRVIPPHGDPARPPTSALTNVVVTSRAAGVVATLAMPASGEFRRFRHTWPAGPADDVLTFADDAGLWEPLTVEVVVRPADPTPPGAAMPPVNSNAFFTPAMAAAHRAALA